MEKRYLIWDIEDKSWYGRNETGLTARASDRGTYSLEEALDLISKVNGKRQIPQIAIVEF